MPKFLDLSRELRDIIYTAVLGSELSPPSSPAESGDRKRTSGRGGLDEEAFEYCNMYSLQPVPVSSSALLRTNRQIHTELAEIISRVKKSKTLRYKLDCLMLDERLIYPTWLSVPALSSSVASVEVDFRLFGDCNGKRSGWAGGDGAPSVIIWSLFALLKRFLLRGPDFLSPPKPGRKIKIGVLVLNVITPSPLSAKGFIPREVPSHQRLHRGRRKGMIDPEVVPGEMESHMGYLLDGSKDMAPYAGIVYNRVRIIRFCLDGDERKVWDLAVSAAHDPATTSA